MGSNFNIGHLDAFYSRDGDVQHEIRKQMDHAHRAHNYIWDIPDDHNDATNLLRDLFEKHLFCKPEDRFTALQFKDHLTKLHELLID